MNKQKWSKLIKEDQEKWWNGNVPFPYDATHTIYGKFYKLCGSVWKYWDKDSSVWLKSHHTVKWLEDNLIPKPVKAYTPRSVEKLETNQESNLIDVDKKFGDLYIPKFGEMCEITYGAKTCWRKFVMGSGFGFCYYSNEWFMHHIDYFTDAEFRPIITERQQKAIDLYRIFEGHTLSDYEIMQTTQFNKCLERL